MEDYFFKIFTPLRNCNVACSPALRLGGASEQLSGLCFQSHPQPFNQPCSYVGHACIFLPCRATLGVSFSTRLIPATHHRIAHLNIPRSPTALPPSLSFPAPRFVFTSSSARRQPSQIKWRSPRPSNVLSSTDSILFPSHPPIP